MNQTIQGLSQIQPSYIADLLLFMALMAGYFFIAFKKHWLPELKPAPKSNLSQMNLWQTVKSVGRTSRHLLSTEEWESIRRCRKVALPIVIGYCIVLGFFASSFGLVFMLWFWIATVGGMLIRHFYDRRIENN